MIQDSYLLIKKIGSKRIEKSLYYIPADCKSAGTLVLLVYAACGTLVLLVLCRLQGIVDNVMAALNIRIVEKQQD